MSMYRCGGGSGGVDFYSAPYNYMEAKYVGYGKNTSGSVTLPENTYGVIIILQQNYSSGALYIGGKGITTFEHASADESGSMRIVYADPSELSGEKVTCSYSSLGTWRVYALVTKGA